MFFSPVTVLVSVATRRTSAPLPKTVGDVTTRVFVPCPVTVTLEEFKFMMSPVAAVPVPPVTTDRTKSSLSTALNVSLLPAGPKDTAPEDDCP